MPQVEIMIGGRSFEVACQEGEETFLRSAAHMLDIEASTLSNQIGRMPEARMLLMAGLMLADKTAALEDKLRDTESKLGDMQVLVDEAQVKAATPQRVEVPVVPVEVTDMLAEIAAQAEALAEDVEQRGRS